MKRRGFLAMFAGLPILEGCRPFRFLRRAQRELLDVESIWPELDFICVTPPSVPAGFATIYREELERWWSDALDDLMYERLSR